MGLGYRLYFPWRKETRVLYLLWGGSKNTQKQDIEKAKNLASIHEE